ncbi:MAG: PaaI family thioesterase [Saprospiraceae bacterium]
MISEYCQAIFDQTPFMQTLGAKLLRAHDGVCEIEAVLDPKLTQHNGFAHAGVQASLADHACGVATASMIEPPRRPLSIEFKINLLRPASGQFLLASARVLRCGKTIAVVECEVFSRSGETSVMTAKMVATIAVLIER